MIRKIVLVIMMILFTSVCSAEVPSFFTKDGSTWIPTAKIYKEADSYVLNKDLTTVGEIETKVIHVLGKKREAFVDVFYVNFNKNAGYMASRKKISWDKDDKLKKEETRSAGVRYSFNEGVMGQIVDAIKDYVKNTYLIFNMSWSYWLGGPGFEQCKGIVINGKDIMQALDEANRASNKEVESRIGADGWRFHKNQALRLDAGKVLYDEEYRYFNRDKVIVHGIFKKNYYNAALPYAEKLGLKLVINNNKFMDEEVKFEPYPYLGLYIPDGTDYMHQRLYINTDKNKPGRVIFTYYENAIANSGAKYPHIGGSVSEAEFADMVHHSSFKTTLKMYHWGVENGNPTYLMDIRIDNNSATCSIRKIASGLNSEEWDIYANDLVLTKEKK